MGLSALPLCPRSPGIRAELANGFQVGTYANANGATHHYIAWKATPGRVAVGQYTGNGDGSNCGTGACGDNRSITGLGFRPEFVQVVNGVTPVPNSSTVFKPASTGSSTDYTVMYLAYQSNWQGPDQIQRLDADSFQIGTVDEVNTSGEPYYYIAFGPGSPASATANYRSIGTAANYSTGQLSVVNGSATVMSIGTSG